MPIEIKKYPVQHPLLKKYIKFFWEIHVEHLQLNNKIIPVRNIDLKFNLNERPHYLCLNGKEQLLEDVYFSGLQDHYRNASVKINGKTDVLGICFQPEGFFPFLKIPVCEFKNQLLGAAEVGFKPAKIISEQLKEAPDVAARLGILEKEFLSLLNTNILIPENFRQIFNALKQNDNPILISRFCQQNNINKRNLERMYNKYVGLSAKSYGTLNRFQYSINRLLYTDYSKLSDLAYDNGYFDQMHFIKEFRRFSGDTPKSFVSQKDSMLQIGKFT
jgi:AraC-like DNA-binding protein